MNKPSSINRPLYVLGVSVAAMIALWAAVLLIGLYYFGANEAIPPILDRIQFIIVWLGAACGALSVAAFVWLVVVVVRRPRVWPRR